MKAIATTVLGLMLAVPALAAEIPSWATQAAKQWEQALNKGDFVALAGLYAENASVLPPGAANIVTGRQAVQVYWQHAVASGLRNASVSPMDVEVFGDAAREIGRFTAEEHDKQGQVHKIEGKYVVVWRKVGNDWRHDTDIWNMNH